jgi:hypothetical protein
MNQNETKRNKMQEEGDNGLSPTACVKQNETRIKKK